MDKLDSKMHVKVFDIGGRFPVWKYGMEIIFKAKKLKGIVDGTLPCLKASAGATAKEIEDWTEKDEQAQMILYEALSLRALETKSTGNPNSAEDSNCYVEEIERNTSEED